MFVSYLLHVSIVGFFTLRKKRIRGGSTFAKGNSGSLKRHLLLAQPTHCLSVTHGYNSGAWMEDGREGARGWWVGVEGSKGKE